MIELHQGDCLNILPTLPPDSIDCLLVDLPYGVTRCPWDSQIPLDKLLPLLETVCKKSACMMFFATQPFASTLVTAWRKWYRFEWVWDKVRPCGFQIAKYKPMQRHEHVLVFCRGKRVPYYPVMELRDRSVSGTSCGVSKSSPLTTADGVGRTYTHKHPQSILKFCKGSDGKGLHPTQKPVALCEYLIRNHTLEGEVVLDCCMGVGSVGVACVQSGRGFVGIELDGGYFEAAKGRIQNQNCEF